MKYKGIELKEITTPNIDNLPKKMLVWDGGFDKTVELVVCATAIDNCGALFFIARDSDEQCGGISYWKHCAEIPEEPKPRRATNRELSRWLAQGNGEYILERTAGMAEHYWNYEDGNEDEPANGYDTGDNELKVRKWSDTEWHEPTVDYMGLEG